VTSNFQGRLERVSLVGMIWKMTQRDVSLLLDMDRSDHPLPQIVNVTDHGLMVREVYEVASEAQEYDAKRVLIRFKSILIARLADGK